MADATYQPKFYRKDGGDTAVVASSGAIEIESGGSLDLQTGSVFKDTTVGAQAERFTFTEKVAFSGTASTAGSVFGWTAPTGADVIVTRVCLNITTQSATAGCVLDVGTTTTSLTTKSDDLLDGLVATGTAAVGAWDNVDDQGTNGQSCVTLAAGGYITCSATGSKATSLAGNAYITYVVA